MQLVAPTDLTGHQIRAHFTICAKRPSASDDAHLRGKNPSVGTYQAANSVRSRAHGEPAAGAFHSASEPAEALKSARASRPWQRSALHARYGVRAERRNQARGTRKGSETLTVR